MECRQTSVGARLSECCMVSGWHRRLGGRRTTVAGDQARAGNRPTTIATPGFFRCFATANPACRLLALSRRTATSAIGSLLGAKRTSRRFGLTSVNDPERILRGAICCMAEDAHPYCHGVVGSNHRPEGAFHEATGICWSRRWSSGDLAACGASSRRFCW
jgi:hypothetical protein